MNGYWMKAATVAAMAFAGVATQASAQALTRAQVRQELIDAERHGMSLVTDASYPDVSPLFRRQVERMPWYRTEAALGSEPAATSEAGRPAVAPSRPGPVACVGPESFCRPYFGS
ncbi:DUF4148 domain-containing protein [Burkholderia anthina]|uniref:DUF4148 domain-containing protein n=1 Tax=Burkholderia anthina TaxID=179879 RepID=UPI00158C36B0|nr:DUF4148 domain-containing protein [Burkholderia anthina]MBY4867845.1 DUF4148 domain-containing protein [Burkholderia anthina]